MLLYCKRIEGMLYMVSELIVECSSGRGEFGPLKEGVGTIIVKEK